MHFLATLRPKNTKYIEFKKELCMYAIDYYHNHLLQTWDRDITSSEKASLDSRVDFLKTKFNEALNEFESYRKDGYDHFINGCLHHLDEVKSILEIKPLGISANEYLVNHYLMRFEDPIGLEQVLELHPKINNIKEFNTTDKNEILFGTDFLDQSPELLTIGLLMFNLEKVIWLRNELDRELKLESIVGFHRKNMKYNQGHVKKMYETLLNVGCIECEFDLFYHFFYFDEKSMPPKRLNFIEWKEKDNVLEYFLKTAIQQVKGPDKYKTASKIFNRDIIRTNKGKPRKEIRDVLDTLVPPK